MINSAEEFIELRDSDTPAKYNRAGKDDAPVSVWWDLIEKYPHMRVWVARNRNIPKEIIHHLSKDDDPIVRDAICSKYPLDIELYLLFSKDSDEGVRARLTFNKGLPMDILKDISENDSSEFVRSQAVDNYKRREY
ncbi:hypothetical protein [Candidatus Pantoea multigeneris]|uniref:HEAT repeat domain-containing protein n=1 Tax=Candidatus Pantoea multigeneris TaxID=2608357 RepID=A0ABX0RCL1_9GAMM|nr:hypothetical protein [Pantoea multigeneris]NIF23091.1 hypothetical protein [Pantoea multigeneris]